MSATAHRTIGVTVVAVVLFIQAILGLAVGIGLVVEASNSSLIEHINQSSGTIQAYGWSAIVWSVVAGLVGFGLWKGASWSRIVVAIMEALKIGGGIYLMFSWSGHYLWQGIWQIGIALFVLWLLFNPRSDEFFGSK